MIPLNFDILLAAQERALLPSVQDQQNPADILNSAWRELIGKYPLIDFSRVYWMPVQLGWWSLLDDCFKSINDGLASVDTERRPRFKIAQIKEKFGALRFYYNLEFVTELTSDDVYKVSGDIASAVDLAEELSHRTCEVCGEPGKLRSGGWLKTLCDEHA